MLIDARFIGNPGQEFDTTISDEVPIFLSTLSCDESDEAIFNCTRMDRVGITRCTHAQDVYVRCQG